MVSHERGGGSGVDHFFDQMKSVTVIFTTVDVVAEEKDFPSLGMVDFVIFSSAVTEPREVIGQFIKATVNVADDVVFFSFVVFHNA